MKKGNWPLFLGFSAVFVAVILLGAIFQIWGEADKSDLGVSENVEQLKCLPLSKECLQQNVAWNPTQMIGPLRRLGEGTVKLTNENLLSEFVYETNFEYLSILHANDDERSEWCDPPNQLENISNGKAQMNFCYRYLPEVYNEFLVLDRVKSEVIHRYQLEQGYTFLRANTSPGGYEHGSLSFTQQLPFITCASPNPAFPETNNPEFVVQMEVRQYDRDRPQQPLLAGLPEFYSLNVLTGEIRKTDRPYDIPGCG